MSTLVDATARAMKPVHISTMIVQLRFEYKLFDLRAMAEKGKTNKIQIEDTAIESKYWYIPFWNAPWWLVFDRYNASAPTISNSVMNEIKVARSSIVS